MNPKRPPVPGKKADEEKNNEAPTPPVGHYMMARPPPPGWSTSIYPPPPPLQATGYPAYEDAAGKPLPPWKLPHTPRPASGIPPIPRPPTAVPGPIQVSVKPAATRYGATPISVTSPAPSAQAADKWPPSLKSYVERCFATCKNDGERDKMEKLLKDRVGKTIADGTISFLNWDAEPLIRLSPAQPSPFAVTQTATKKKKQTFVPVPVNQTSFTVSNSAVIDEEEARKRERAERFTAPKPKNRKAAVSSSAPDLSQAAEVLDWDEHTIVGTMTQLEKSYLRLTSAPDPATVRPLPVLRKTLEFLKAKWLQGRDYAYICDQFKSLRQDLTVQRIKNDFTVSVYEIHARIALEKADMGEYNQCQSMLVPLYDAGLQGNELEFIAYRILYYLGTKNRQALSGLMADLTPEQHNHPAIKHALDVRSAVALGNYHRLFKLYNTAPNMGAHLMNVFIARERTIAMSVICKAYRPSVRIDWLKETLAFETKDGLEKFLQQANVEPLPDIDTKTAMLAFP